MSKENKIPGSIKAIIKMTMINAMYKKAVLAKDKNELKGGVMI